MIWALHNQAQQRSSQQLLRRGKQWRSQAFSPVKFTPRFRNIVEYSSLYTVHILVNSIVILARKYYYYVRVKGLLNTPYCCSNRSTNVLSPVISTPHQSGILKSMFRANAVPITDMIYKKKIAELGKKLKKGLWWKKYITW